VWKCFAEEVALAYRVAIERQIGPLAAIRKLAPDADVQFAVADDMTGTTISPEMLSHDGKPGLERTDVSGTKSVDAALDFTHTNGKALPANTVATWKGDLTAPDDGEYWLYHAGVRNSRDDQRRWKGDRAHRGNERNCPR